MTNCPSLQHGYVEFKCKKRLCRQKDKNLKLKINDAKHENALLQELLKTSTIIVDAI